METAKEAMHEEGRTDVTTRPFISATYSHIASGSFGTAGPWPTYRTTRFSSAKLLQSSPTSGCHDIQYCKIEARATTGSYLVSRHVSHMGVLSLYLASHPANVCESVSSYRFGCADRHMLPSDRHRPICTAGHKLTSCVFDKNKSEVHHTFAWGLWQISSSAIKHVRTFSMICPMSHIFLESAVRQGALLHSCLREHHASPEQKCT